MLRDALDANLRCRPMRRLRRVVSNVGREPGFGATLPRGCGVPHGMADVSMPPQLPRATARRLDPR